MFQIIPKRSIYDRYDKNKLLCHFSPIIVSPAALKQNMVQAFILLSNYKVVYTKLHKMVAFPILIFYINQKHLFRSC